MMSRLHHPRVVQFFGVTEGADATPSIMMEFCPAGSLETYVFRNDHRIKKKLRLAWCDQMAQGALLSPRPVDQSTVCMY